MIWLKTDRHKKRRPRANHKYTKEVVVSVIQEHKCITYADFRRINEYAYNQAKKNGWLPELGLIQDNPGRKFWTKEKVFEVSRNYSNKTDFENKAKTAFLKAMSNGWQPLMTWLKPLPLGIISKWTREAIIEESKKYTSRTEFAINSQTAYQHACEDKTIFKEMPWIKEKKKPDGYWDVKEHVMEEGKKI